MTRIRYLTAALAAFGTLGALLASPALATYDTEAGTVELQGVNTTPIVLTTEFGEVSCETGTVSGTLTAVSEPEAGVHTDHEIRVHPKYSKCEALGFEATINTEGCEYVYTTATTTTGTFAAHAIKHIQCTAGHAIEIAAAGGLCSIDIPAQENLGLVDFENTNPGAPSERDVDVHSTANEIEYEGVGGFCSGAGEELGTLGYTTTIRAYSGGNQVGFWVT